MISSKCYGMGVFCERKQKTKNKLDTLEKNIWKKFILITLSQNILKLLRQINCTNIKKKKRLGLVPKLPRVGAQKWLVGNNGWKMCALSKKKKLWLITLEMNRWKNLRHYQQTYSGLQHWIKPWVSLWHKSHHLTSSSSKTTLLWREN